MAKETFDPQTGNPLYDVIIPGAAPSYPDYNGSPSGGNSSGNDPSNTGSNTNTSQGSTDSDTSTPDYTTSAVGCTIKPSNSEYTAMNLNQYEFKVNFKEGVHAQISPDPSKDTPVKDVKGECTVVAIGFHENTEKWKVEIVSDTGVVETRWVDPDDDAVIQDKGVNSAAYAIARGCGEYHTIQQMEYDRVYNKGKGIAGSMMDEAQQLAYKMKAGINDIQPTVVIGSGENVACLYTSYNTNLTEYDAYVGKLTKVFGMPPQWTKYVDRRLDFGSNHLIGRRYAQTVLVTPSILSMSPGYLKVTGGLATALGAAVNGGDPLTTIQDVVSTGATDPFWDFEEDWDSYIQYYNLLCRYAVVCLSADTENNNDYDFGDTPLSQRPVPWGKGYYKNIDVSEFLSPELNTRYSNGILKGMAKSISDLNSRFVHYSANGNLSTAESFSTETRSSFIEDAVNGVASNMIKDIGFITTGVVGGDLQGDLDQFSNLAASTLGGGLGAVLSATLECLKGGYISFPQLIDRVNWGREFTFTVKLITVYGDVESRFLQVIMPYMGLASLFLPRQLPSKIDMYAYPPVVRAFAKGIYACQCGVVTNVNVKRGGDNDTAWTASGQPMEIDVEFSIKSLHQNLMQSNNLVWFLKNSGLQMYIGTICGIDMTMPHIDLVKETINALSSGFFQKDIKREIIYYIDKVLNNNPITAAIESVANISNGG